MSLHLSESLSGLPPQELSAILNGLPDPLIFLNMAGRVAAANLPALKLLQYEAEDIRELPLDRLLQRRDLAHLIPQKLLEHGRFKNFYTNFLTSRGTVVPVSLSNTILYDASERPIGIVLVARDFREMDALYRQLVQSSKMSALGHMAAGIAHEINNPLTGILGLSELLLDPTDEMEAGLASDLHSIRDQAIRCRDVVQRLLSMSRSQTEVTCEKVDLNAVLRATLSNVDNQLKLDQVTLELELEPNLPFTWSDPHQLGQVFLNLIINACKAMSAGGVLRLRTAVQKHRLIAEVQDSGVGIPSSDMSRIFDPFFTTRPAGEGIGLGLCICQTIMRSLGGEIAVRSQVGSGSTFTVFLPYLEPAIQGLAWDSMERAADRRSTERVRQAITVRLCENDQEVRVLTQDLGAGGLRLTHNSSLDPHKDYLLHLVLQEETLSVFARVAWQRYQSETGSFDMGFQFIDLEAQDRQRLATYIERSVREGAPILGRRRYVRVPRLMFVDVTAHGSESEVTSGLILDLNGGGAKILCSLPLEVGCSLVLHVELEEGQVHSLPCTVRWASTRPATEDGHRHLCGVEFERFTDELHTLIEKYLADRDELRRIDLLQGLLTLLNPEGDNRG